MSLSQASSDLSALDMTLGGSTQAPGGMPTDKKNPLDSEENRKVLRQLEEWLEVERIRQAPNRYQMAIDDDFYDNLQWGDEDAAKLAGRGQAPLVYNKVQPAVKWITGTEKRTKFDFKVFPRKKGAVDEAENKTKLLKYISDVNKSAFTRSRSFEGAVKSGLGWLECGIRGDPTQELIYDRAESWRNMIYDSQGIEWDASDWRYMYRWKWVDLDIAQALFPKRKHALKSVAVFSDFADAQENEEWYLGQILQERSADGSVLNRRTFIDTSTSLFNRRARVRLYEAWYRRPMTMRYWHAPGTKHHNTEIDRVHPHHIALYQQMQGQEDGGESTRDGAISIYDRLGMQMWCAVFVRGALCQNMRSPYKHNDFPFTPVWGNRRARDNAPYGMIRVMRDPQESYNKRMSKALFAMSTRRIIADEGAVEDPDELREEAARPDAIIFKKKNHDLEMTTELDIADAHVKYAEMDAQAIQDQGGVTDELLAKSSQAVSGVAIEHRQDQGTVVTTDFFDNLRLAAQLHGQKILSLASQFYTEEKEIRIIGQARGDDYITLNKPTQMADGGLGVENPITEAEADFIVDETDYKISTRQAMVETLQKTVNEMMSVNPQAAMALLADVLDFSDIPGLDQIVKSIRQQVGAPDPTVRVTPEAQAQMDQKFAEQQAMLQAGKVAELQLAQEKVNNLRAKTTELQNRAALLSAQAQEIGAGDDGAQASYNEAVQKLQEDTETTLDALRNELITANRQTSLADMRALDHTKDVAAKIKTAEITSNTAITVANLNNESKERIAAAADRTQEATIGLKANIEGLAEQLQQLARQTGDQIKNVQSRKLDKPGLNLTGDSNPFQKINSRLDQHDQGLGKQNEAVQGLTQGKLDKPKGEQPPADPIGALGKRVEKVEKGQAKQSDAVKGLSKTKLDVPMSKPAPEDPIGHLTRQIARVGTQAKKAHDTAKEAKELATAE